MKKICIICGQEFETRDSRTVCCRNKDCRRQFGRMKYATNTAECICKQCGKTYLATAKQSHELCPNCVRSEPYDYKNKIEQKHCCRQCKKILFTEIKNTTRDISEFMYDKTCEDCKEKNNQSSSERMILNNPSCKNRKYNSVEEAKAAKKQRQEDKRKYKTDEERKAAMSDRMKKNNPMFDAKVKQKSHDTLMKRIEIGEIVYDRTKSKNYKGDRGIKNYIRLSIAWWRKENFERANYTCECCGKTSTYLQVHHIEKFSDLVERFAKELNLNLKTLKYKSDDYNRLEKLVNNYHKEHNIGIVVCENCHDKIDKCFHKRKFLEVDEDEGNQD